MNIRSLRQVLIDHPEVNRLLQEFAAAPIAFQSSESFGDFVLHARGEDVLLEVLSDRSVLSIRFASFKDATWHDANYILQYLGNEALPGNFFTLVNEVCRQKCTIVDTLNACSRELVAFEEQLEALIVSSFQAEPLGDDSQ